MPPGTAPPRLPEDDSPRSQAVAYLLDDPPQCLRIEAETPRDLRHVLVYPPLGSSAYASHRKSYLVIGAALTFPLLSWTSPPCGVTIILISVWGTPLSSDNYLRSEMPT